MEFFSVVVIWWEEVPKLMIVFVNFLLALLLIMIKYYYDKFKREQEILESSEIFLLSFLRILSSAILNSDKELAKDHYKILLTNSYLFKKNKVLYENYKKFQSYYISLQIGNYDGDENKQNKQNASSDIDNLIRKLENKNNY